MKKSINLLSLLAITTLLSCTSEVIKQNVSINNTIKPTPRQSITLTPSPNTSKLPIEVKPSPIESPTPMPSVTISPKIEEKKYTSANFYLKNELYKYKYDGESIFEAPILSTIKEEKDYYTKIHNSKTNSYYNDLDNIYLIDSGNKINLEILYPDGTIDTDYNIEIPEEFKDSIEIKNNALFKLNENASYPYIKVSSKRNRQIFKFFDIVLKNERHTFNGKVLDPLGNPVEGAIIKARLLEPHFLFNEKKYITTNDGKYVFREFLSGPRILITVTKEGWTTRENVGVVKGLGNMDPYANIYNFEGIYALQDEPEITSLNVNGKKATATGPALKPSIEIMSNSSANLSGLDNSKLEVEMTFSEPVITSDIENYFRVTSQDFGGKTNNHIVIDKNTEGIKFEWSENNQKVKISLNKQLIANNTASEARYIIDFVKPFRDLNNKEARTKYHIRYNPANSGDFHVFSIKNDDTNPKLLSITALDGKDNDIIELNFTKPMNYWGFKSNILELVDPLSPNNEKRSKRIYQANNLNLYNATVLGYSKINDSISLSDFVVVYTIGRLTSPITNNQTITPLNINKIIYGGLIDGSSIISAKILDNKVRLELPSTAFNKGDKIILAVGDTITGSYEDKNNGIGRFPIEVNLSGIPKGTITDIIGNLISKGTSSFENNVTINDLQKTAIVE